MRVENRRNKKLLIKISKMVRTDLGTGKRGDMGTSVAHLECGHTVTGKYSQMKDKQYLFCNICANVRHLESGLPLVQVLYQ